MYKQKNFIKTKGISVSSCISAMFLARSSVREINISQETKSHSILLYLDHGNKEKIEVISHVEAEKLYRERGN